MNSSFLVVYMVSYRNSSPIIEHLTVNAKNINSAEDIAFRAVARFVIGAGKLDKNYPYEIKIMGVRPHPNRKK